MSRRHELVYALNAGGVDKQALSRVDLEKLRLAGEHPVVNWLPRVLGPMSIRPGMEHLYFMPGNKATRLIPFVRDSATTSLLLATDQAIYIQTDGALVQVVGTGSYVLNPDFTLALTGSFATGWKDDSIVGGGTVIPTASSGGGSGLVLTATRSKAASVQQQVAVPSGSENLAHTVRIVVGRGPVYVRMGQVQDSDNLLPETKLATGTHKLTVTPFGTELWIKIRSEDPWVQRIVTQVQFEHVFYGGAAPLILPTPWLEADLPYLSWDQSADVVVIGDGTRQQRQIERRGPTSWSITTYEPRNGPFQVPKTTKITMTPSAQTGNGLLTASLPYFRPDHVGAVFELTQEGSQYVVDQLSAADETTDYVTVTGLWHATKAINDRNLQYVITATGFTGTVVLERSTDENAENWTTYLTFNAGATATINDEQSNLRVRYRFRMSAYTAGYVDVTLFFNSGTTTGQVKCTAYNSSTQVYMEVIGHLYSLTPTRDWRAPMWSDLDGWPRVPRYFDGRLWWFRRDQAFGSISDDYNNYDDTKEGDSGPIIRTIGSGAAEGARWALDMQRLIVGTAGYEASIRSSSFDEPLTPTAFTARNASTLGSSFVPALKVDRGAFFVQRSGKRLYELLYSVETNDYTSKDLSRLNPQSLGAGVKAMAVQRQPDTRLYVVLNDGTAVVVTYERDDQVVAFTTIQTDGFIEDVSVLPSLDQDDVYWLTLRDVGGTGWRMVERMAKEAPQESVDTCMLLDGASVRTGAVNVVTGLHHLEGKRCAVWADGQRRGDITVRGAGGTLDGTYARAVIGLPYLAIYKSVKLAYAGQLGTAIGQTKAVRRAGLILHNSTLDELGIGPDAERQEPVPEVINGTVRVAGQFFGHYDQDLFPIQTEWSSDSRVFLRADSSGGPKTVQAIILDVETRDGVPSQARNGG